MRHLHLLAGISMAGNLALAAALLHARGNHARITTGIAVGSTSATQPGDGAKTTVVSPTHSVVPVTPSVWSRIESPDYPVYMANLRGLGVPEETLRDILLADIRKSYSMRAAALSNPSHPELERLEAEEATVLDSLLGPDWREDLRRIASELPDSARLGRFGDLAGRIAEIERQSAHLPETSRNSDLLRQLAALLPLPQLAGYLRENHPTGLEMASEGFAYRDDTQWLAIFRARIEFDAAMASTDDTRTDIGEAELKRDEALRAALGTAYADYARRRDPLHQAVSDAMEGLPVSPEVIGDVAAIHRRAQSEVARLETEGLPDAALDAAQADVARHAEAEIASLLGPVGLEAYRTRFPSGPPGTPPPTHPKSVPTESP